MPITLEEIAETCERLLPEWERRVSETDVYVEQPPNQQNGLAASFGLRGFAGLSMRGFLWTADELRQHSETVNRLLMINAIIVAHDPEVCSKIQAYLDAVYRETKS